MAFYVFNWTKREYILAVLSLVLLVITAKHQEYFCCKEKPLSNFEKFGIWLGLVEEPKPCPGEEELISMAIEMGVASAAVLASTGIPKLWNWSKMGVASAAALASTGISELWNRSTSILGHVGQAVKRGFQYLKDRVPFRKATNHNPDESPPKYKYFFFRNAYEQRKILMVAREGEVYEQIFVYSPEKKKMECVMCYPKGLI
ncbi:uncharacterized protein LOC134263836 [Saccostrea cucullata]|uniref:uncharacterized protein LOC134263836 n=1 Tax=Saccostrea cuccullata TaxID=36930 RepID=UPI002ED66D3F